ncbi:phosphatidate cytidylyltransferase [Marinomonas sp. C2222]|uniref:Phosphatidate cytidylyltransferase n=1 Tax=Marinomonas sargassi TaxID=2984494 RepID=A0ABT2YV82_9GAMM|nr:phosphatidate cytidylyltransferase [Marinomonas sargassi]MCV2403810.1 phosphatidate cytidylyltransferase [Marinomonas sargassi]
MLLPRILSAIVMAALFLGAVFVASSNTFSWSMLGVVLLAGWEWARLSGIKAQLGRILYAVLVGAICALLGHLNLAQNTLFLAPVLWLLALYWVARYPDPLVWRHSIVRLIFGVFVLTATWSALVVLKSSEGFITWVLVLMGLIWGADSGAYFAGRAFGKRKLAKYVSPGKSWEGVFGGLIITQIGIVAFSVWSDYSLSSWFLLAIIALVTASVSVLGDLMESLLKRYEEIKDSSQLIPGHGGVMDRVDSLTAAAPTYVLLLTVFGWL